MFGERFLFLLYLSFLLLGSGSGSGSGCFVVVGCTGLEGSKSRGTVLLRTVMAPLSLLLLLLLFAEDQLSRYRAHHSIKMEKVKFLRFCNYVTKHSTT